MYTFQGSLAGVVNSVVGLHTKRRPRLEKDEIRKEERGADRKKKGGFVEFKPMNKVLPKNVDTL